MIQVIAFLWDKLPGYIKWPVSIAFFLFLVPLKLRDEAIGFVHSEVHAVIMPMKEKRDMQILQMDERLKRIENNTDTIQKILMERNK